MTCAPDQWEDKNYNCVPQLPYPKYAMYATLLSVAAWCGVLVLAVNIFRSKFKDQDVYSLRLRYALLGYVVVMTGISTGALIEDVVFVDAVLFSWTSVDLAKFTHAFFVTPRSSSIPLMLAMFGADSLMFWRCWILYQSVYRTLRFFVNCFFVFLLMLSLGCIAYSAFNLTISPFNIPRTQIYATVGVNSIISVMIAVRLLVYEHDVKTVLGVESGSSPFRKAISICVESCALIVICGALAIGLIVQFDDQVVSMLASIPLTLQTHVCVISPLLLTARVVNGQAHSTTVPLVSHSMRFFRPPSAGETDSSVWSVA